MKEGRAARSASSGAGRDASNQRGVDAARGTIARSRPPARNLRSTGRVVGPESEGGSRRMLKLLVWLLLFVVCWPLALLALILYPLVWLLSLPFRLLGITLEAVFSFLKALLFLPARLLGGPKAA